MNNPILSPVALAYTEREFWQRHAADLRRKQATAPDDAHLAALLKAEAFAVRRWSRACDEHNAMKFRQS